MAISVEQTSSLSLGRRLLKIDNLKLTSGLLYILHMNHKTVGDYHKCDSIYQTNKIPSAM